MAGLCEDCTAGERDCACNPDDTCVIGLRCDTVSVCETCPGGEEGCPCDGDACDDGLWCMEDLCAPLTYEDISGSCVANQLCSEGDDGEDAYCDAACMGNFRWDALMGVCVPTGLSNCTSGDPNSILEICAPGYRVQPGAVGSCCSLRSLRP